MKKQIESQIGATQLKIEKGSQTRKVKSLHNKSNLHEQFQSLKQKIKDIQHKNTRALEQIHQTYNFKKKSFHSYDLKDSEKRTKKRSRKEGRYIPGQSSILTFGDKDDALRLQMKTRDLQQKLSSECQTSRIKNIIHQEFHQNEDKDRESRIFNQSEIINKRINDMKETSSRQEKKLSPALIKNEEDKLKSLKNKLESVLLDLVQKEKQIEILKKNQTKIKSYYLKLKQTLDKKLQLFFFNTTNSCFSVIEKAVRKNQIKIKNLRKISLRLKDSQEEKKSNKLIQMRKTRRNSGSKSRSKSINKQQKTNRSQKNIQQKNKQFQEIANRYQVFIKQKVQQVQTLDQKFRDKQRQCHELRIKIDLFQKKNSSDESKLKTISESNIFIKGEEFEQKKNNESYFQERQQQLVQKETLLHEKDMKICELEEKLNIFSLKMEKITDEYQQILQKNSKKFREQMKQQEQISGKRLSQINDFKYKISGLEKKILSKDYQIENIKNKLNKNEVLLANKQNKIQQLQKLLTIGEESKQNFEESLSMIDSSKDYKKLHENIDTLENQLEKQKSQNYLLIKQKEELTNKLFQLQKLLSEKNIFEQKSIFWKKENEQLQLENHNLKDEIGKLKVTISTLENELQTNIKVNEGDILDLDDEIDFKHEHKVIPEQQQENESSYRGNILSDDGVIDSEPSMEQVQSKEQIVTQRNSEIEQVKQSLIQLQQKYNKLLSEFKMCTEENQCLKIELHSKMDIIQSNEKKFLELQNQVLDFTQKKSISTVPDTDLNEKIKQNQTGGENQELKIKIRQLESEVHIHKQMETKVLNEYKTNLSITRIKLQEEQEQNQELAAEIQALRRTVNSLSTQLQEYKTSSNKDVFRESKPFQNNQLLEKVQNLEHDLSEAKDLIHKLEDVETQLFREVKIYEQQKSQLMKELESKDKKIYQLQEYLEIKNSPQASKHNFPQRPSIHSQNSLKYSSNSQLLLSSSLFHQNRNIEQNVAEIEASEAGSQIHEQNSQISHLQDFFVLEQQTYKKSKNLRVHYNSLLKKTTLYIKTLKTAVQQKNKRIKTLEKKIQMLKDSELVRKQLKIQGMIQEGGQEQWVEGVFKDYESVELGRKKSHRKKIKILEDDTNLVIQENMILSEKIQKLEEELLKSEEQEQSLCKIKDLYKQEIKNLIKQIEEQKKDCDLQLLKQRKKLEESESTHNMQAMKQLFYKIVEIYSFKFTEDHPGAKKKQQKRRQLEQYVKIMSNILKCDKRMKEKLITMLHK